MPSIHLPAARQRTLVRFREGGRRHAGLVRIKLHYEAAVHTAPGERMDSEEPPNVRVACSGDIDEVVRLMHDAAAWMSAKGTPAWDVARIDRTFAETFVLRSELLVASCSDGIVGCCTLSAEDPEFWPDALKGRPHICTSSRCDGHMRAGVSAPR